MQFPIPRHMPCERCGASVAYGEADHVCDDGRRVEFELFQLRSEIAAFDDQLREWLDSPPGRFEQFDAERRRRG